MRWNAWLLIGLATLSGCSEDQAAEESSPVDSGDADTGADSSSLMDGTVDSSTADTSTEETADSSLADSTMADTAIDSVAVDTMTADGGTTVQVAQVVAGDLHTCALKTDGTVWCWGGNDRGELGSDLGTNHYKPIQVAEVGSTVKQIAAGHEFTCALKTEGSVWCWGANNFGQLGDGTGTDSTAAVQITSLGTSVTSIVSDHDGYHSCALKSDGSVWCWGGNAFGQLGVGTITPSLAPVKVAVLDGDAAATATAISASFGDTTVLGSDGSVWIWGGNQSGQLATGSKTGPDTCGGYACSRTPYHATAFGSTVTQTANGDLYTCVRKADGTVWCLGSNSHGQQGTTPFTDAGAPPDTFTPVQVTALGTNTKSIAIGTAHTCAIENDESLWCWGWGNTGQIGNGTSDAGAFVDTALPVKVLDGVTSVTASASHTCAIDTSKKLWCWGFNIDGRIGDGTVTTRGAPVAVVW